MCLTICSRTYWVSTKSNSARIVSQFSYSLTAQSNVKAFLTHGDSFGIQEAIYNAVPIIALPLLMDQINVCGG